MANEDKTFTKKQVLDLWSSVYGAEFEIETFEGVDGVMQTALLNKTSRSIVVQVAGDEKEALNRLGNHYDEVQFDPRVEAKEPVDNVLVESPLTDAEVERRGELPADEVYASYKQEDGQVHIDENGFIQDADGKPVDGSAAAVSEAEANDGTKPDGK